MSKVRGNRLMENRSSSAPQVLSAFGGEKDPEKANANLEEVSPAAGTTMPTLPLVTPGNLKDDYDYGDGARSTLEIQDENSRMVCQVDFSMEEIRNITHDLLERKYGSSLVPGQSPGEQPEMFFDANSQSFETIESPSDLSQYSGTTPCIKKDLDNFTSQALSSILKSSPTPARKVSFEDGSPNLPESSRVGQDDTIDVSKKLLKDSVMAKISFFEQARKRQAGETSSKKAIREHCKKLKASRETAKQSLEAADRKASKTDSPRMGNRPAAKKVLKSQTKPPADNALTNNLKVVDLGKKTKLPASAKVGQVSALTKKLHEETLKRILEKEAAAVPSTSKAARTKNKTIQETLSKFRADLHKTKTAKSLAGEKTPNKSSSSKSHTQSRRHGKASHLSSEKSVATEEAKSSSAASCSKSKTSDATRGSLNSSKVGKASSSIERRSQKEAEAKTNKSGSAKNAPEWKYWGRKLEAPEARTLANTYCLRQRMKFKDWGRKSTTNRESGLKSGPINTDPSAFQRDFVMGIKSCLQCIHTCLKKDRENNPQQQLPSIPEDFARNALLADDKGLFMKKLTDESSAPDAGAEKAIKDLKLKYGEEMDIELPSSSRKVEFKEPASCKVGSKGFKSKATDKKGIIKKRDVADSFNGPSTSGLSKGFSLPKTIGYGSVHTPKTLTAKTAKLLENPIQVERAPSLDNWESSAESISSKPSTNSVKEKIATFEQISLSNLQEKIKERTCSVRPSLSNKLLETAQTSLKRKPCPTTNIERILIDRIGMSCKTEIQNEVECLEAAFLRTLERLNATSNETGVHADESMSSLLSSSEEGNAYGPKMLYNQLRAEGGEKKCHSIRENSRKFIFSVQKPGTQADSRIASFLPSSSSTSNAFSVYQLAPPSSPADLQAELISVEESPEKKFSSAEVNSQKSESFSISEPKPFQIASKEFSSSTGDKGTNIRPNASTAFKENRTAFQSEENIQARTYSYSTEPCAEDDSFRCCHNQAYVKTPETPNVHLRTLGLVVDDTESSQGGVFARLSNHSRPFQGRILDAKETLKRSSKSEMYLSRGEANVRVTRSEKLSVPLEVLDEVYSELSEEVMKSKPSDLKIYESAHKLEKLSDLSKAYLDPFEDSKDLIIVLRSFKSETLTGKSRRDSLEKGSFNFGKRSFSSPSLSTAHQRSKDVTFQSCLPSSMQPPKPLDKLQLDQLRPYLEDTENAKPDEIDEEVIRVSLESKADLAGMEGEITTETVMGVDKHHQSCKEFEIGPYSPVKAFPEAVPTTIPDEIGPFEAHAPFSPQDFYIRPNPLENLRNCASGPEFYPSPEALTGLAMEYYTEEDGEIEGALWSSPLIAEANIILDNISPSFQAYKDLAYEQTSSNLKPEPSIEEISYPLYTEAIADPSYLDQRMPTALPPSGQCYQATEIYENGTVWTSSNFHDTNQFYNFELPDSYTKPSGLDPCQRPRTLRKTPLLLGETENIPFSKNLKVFDEHEIAGHPFVVGLSGESQTSPNQIVSEGVLVPGMAASDLVVGDGVCDKTMQSYMSDIFEAQGNSGNSYLQKGCRMEAKPPITDFQALKTSNLQDTSPQGGNDSQPNYIKSIQDISCKVAFCFVMHYSIYADQTVLGKAVKLSIYPETQCSCWRILLATTNAREIPELKDHIDSAMLLNMKHSLQNDITASLATSTVSDSDQEVRAKLDVAIKNLEAELANILCSEPEYFDISQILTYQINQLIQKIAKLDLKAITLGQSDTSSDDHINNFKPNFFNSGAASSGSICDRFMSMESLNAIVSEYVNSAPPISQDFEIQGQEAFNQILDPLFASPELNYKQIFRSILTIFIKTTILETLRKIIKRHH